MKAIFMADDTRLFWGFLPGHNTEYPPACSVLGTRPTSACRHIFQPFRGEPGEGVAEGFNFYLVKKEPRLLSGSLQGIRKAIRSKSMSLRNVAEDFCDHKGHNFDGFVAEQGNATAVLLLNPRRFLKYQSTHPCPEARFWGQGA